MADGPGAVPAVGQVPGRHRDQPVEEQGQGQQYPDADVADAELLFQGGDHPPHHVLVDLVHEQDEAQYPHRFGEQPHEEGAPHLGHRLTGGLLGVRGREVWGEAEGYQGGRARLVVGVEHVVGRGVAHGGTFCTMAAISWARSAPVAEGSDAAACSTHGAHPRRHCAGPGRPRGGRSAAAAATSGRPGEDRLRRPGAA